MSSAISPSIDLYRDAGRLYRLEILDGLGPTRFYQDILSFLEKIRLDQDILSEFPYDWRLSIADNAKELQRFLCALDKAQSPRPINFVAHSMGGLVLRHWLKFHMKEGCGIGNSLQVSNILFLGVPVYGSSKSVLAAFNGYTHFF